MLDGSDTDRLPTAAEALDQPLRALPSWFLRVVCAQCGAEHMISEAHTPQNALTIREIINHTRHDGCGGRPGLVEVVTGIAGSSSPVRRIVLSAGG